MAGETQPQRPSGMEESYDRTQKNTNALIRVSHRNKFSGGANASEREASYSVGLYSIIGRAESLFGVDSNSLSPTLWVYI